MYTVELQDAQHNYIALVTRTHTKAEAFKQAQDAALYAKNNTFAETRDQNAFDGNIRRDGGYRIYKSDDYGQTRITLGYVSVY